MIRSDYQAYLSKLKVGLVKVGFVYSGFKEFELGAEFILQAGWSLCLDCERYGSGVTVLIRNERVGRKDGYALWLLMEVFGNLTGESFGKPSIDNQLEFLSKYRDRIFSDTAFFDAAYSIRNGAL